jgi:hypothetical protein
MIARAVTSGVVAMIWLLSNQSISQGAPTPTDGANVVLNRQIATMVYSQTPSGTLHPSVLEVRSPRTATDQTRQTRRPDWLSSPTFIAIASRFTSAERFLHYRHGGVDANFWGVLNRSRAVRVEYSIHL